MAKRAPDRIAARGAHRRCGCRVGSSPAQEQRPALRGPCAAAGRLASPCQRAPRPAARARLHASANKKGPDFEGLGASSELRRSLADHFLARESAVLMPGEQVFMRVCRRSQASNAPRNAPRLAALPGVRPGRSAPRPQPCMRSASVAPVPRFGNCRPARLSAHRSARHPRTQRRPPTTAARGYPTTRLATPCRTSSTHKRRGSNYPYPGTVRRDPQTRPTRRLQGLETALPHVANDSHLGPSG